MKEERVYFDGGLQHLVVFKIYFWYEAWMRSETVLGLMEVLGITHNIWQKEALLRDIFAFYEIGNRNGNNYP